MPLRFGLAVLATAAALTAAASFEARAQTFSEPALEALLRADRDDELRRIVAPRVAARADDEQAVLGLAVLALGAPDAAPRKAAIAAAEACVERNPKSAACQWSLGTTLGVQSMNDGMMAAARSFGRVRDALAEAHALAPNWWPARSALVEMYLEAPGFMGGSASKAEAMAKAAPTAEQQKALAARVAIQADRHEQALAMLAAHKPGADAALDDDVRGWGRRAAFALVNAGQPAKARAWFEQQMRERPADALPPYGLARVLTESGQPAEALALFERASKAKGADELPIAYRWGIALQAAGKADAAKAQFRQFVAAGKGPKRNLDDAKKRLGELGG
jgi:tetratricopeptide (TPR) repeat protein